MEREATFPNDATSVHAARQFVDDVLTEVPADVRQAVITAVSELATNAVLHAASTFDVKISYGSPTGSIRVDVTDSGGGSPARKRPGLTDQDGRGLQIVDVVTDRWGVDWEPHLHQKTVWFELDPSEP